MKVIVINGPNINMLGIREPDIYGRKTYSDLEDYVNQYCKAENVDYVMVQSNHEGVIVDIIQDALGKFDAIVINPAAYTHTSVAIADALKAVALPAVEVHLTDPDSREEYRRVSYTAEACIAVVKGKGFGGYGEAISRLKDSLSGECTRQKDLNL